MVTITNKFPIVGEKREVLYFENFDLENIMTPVDVDKLHYWLKKTNYDPQESDYLVDGFINGFDLGYRGPEVIQQKSQNLKFTIGDKLELWNKVMKEVKEKRYAGPFREIPFENYIQSPIGLVPKDGGQKTRLIFHLSHPRNRKRGFSVNGNTPETLTKVKYKDFDAAVKLCIQEGKGCAMGKSDMTSAFRHLAMKKKYWKFLVMKAQSPLDDLWYYFVDKCMPFGASISCAHFQSFSNAVAHIVMTLSKRKNINYLDDFFFTALKKAICDGQIQLFLDICSQIKFPVSMEKTFWGTTRLVFLGLLIDTVNQLICIPVEKIEKAKSLINKVINKPNNKTRKKVTLHDLQSITGFLNFLCKAVVPGRAFTRRLYSIQEGAENNFLKKHHHINLTSEMKMDLRMWLSFLEHPSIYARSFMDMDNTISSTDVDFFTDASANAQLGCGGISGKDWFIMQWNENFIKKFTPSINYLELYAVMIAVENWIYKYKNQRIYIFCDNMSVVQMINSTTSRCKNCMVLLRLMVLRGLTHNVKISAKHVPGKLNVYSDYLSRLKYKQFRQLARKENRQFSSTPANIPESLKMEDLWIKNKNLPKKKKATKH